MMKIIEPIFDIAYLVAVFILGIIMISKGGGRKEGKLFGILSLVLVCGDAFHLVPRIINHLTDGKDLTAALGIGKLVTSVTMTVFYLLLYYFILLHTKIKPSKAETVAVWLLTACRILLCFLPQNAWTSAEPPLSFGIIRNIPFLILGILIVVLLFIRERGDKFFGLMWLAVLLSFAFYIPVVLFASTVPMMGMLMLPKTVMYVWIVVMGFRAVKADHRQ